MSNEILYGVCVLTNLGIGLASFRAGRSWLQTYIVINLLLTSCVAGRIIRVAGLETTAAGPFYAAVFLATDLMSEHHGTKAAFRSVAQGFFAIIAFGAFSQGVLLLEPIPQAKELGDAMQIVFSTSLRIAVASAAAYLVAQNFDVWMYDQLHRRTGDKLLWIRNNGSTIASQTIDTVVFFFVAFYGVLDNWMEVAISGGLLKLAIALIDTPFLYMSYFVQTTKA